MKRILTLVLALATLSGVRAEGFEGVEVVEVVEVVETTETRERAEAREEHRMNRGLIDLTDTFVPRGQWIAGLTASYSTHNNDNYTFTLIEGINSEGYTVKASPFLLYAINNNVAVGGAFSYKRALTRIYDANISIGGEDDGVQIVVNDFYTLTNRYTASAVFRQYIPFGAVKRFAFFTDISLEGGAFQSKFAHDVPVHGTYATGYTFGLGITPGLVAFATNDVAFELSIGIAGVNFTHTDQVHNQVYYGDVDSANFNFRIDLFSIGFGVAFYL